MRLHKMPDDPRDYAAGRLQMLCADAGLLLHSQGHHADVLERDQGCR